MPKQLLRKIESIRRRAIVLVWVRAICFLILTSYLSLMAIVLLDWALQSDSMALRFGLFAAVLMAMVFAIVRWLLPALDYRPDEVEVARRIEIAQGGWQDELSTSVQIARQQASSRSAPNPWQANLIQRSLEKLKPFSASRLVKFRSLYKPIGVLTLVAAVGGFLFAAQKNQVRFSLNRILQPWTTANWPRENDWVVEYLPDRVKQGESVTFTVRDRNQRSADIVVAIARDDVGRQDQTIFLEPADNDPSTFVGRFENLQMDTWLRVSGGDDATPWHLIEVVNAPGLADVELQWRHPAIANGVWQDVDGRLRCWPGSEIKVRGSANMPLASAAFASSTESGFNRTPLVIKNRVDFETIDSFPVLEESGTWWLELRSEQGVDSIDPESFVFEVMSDQSPNIVVKIDDRMAGVKSRLRFSVAVTDEMTIASARLNLFLNELAPRGSLGQRDLLLTPDGSGTAGFQHEFSANDEIDLATRQNLNQGDKLLIAVEASDLAGNRSQSNPPTQVSIVDEDTLRQMANKRTAQLGRRLSELANQQAALVDQMGQIPAALDPESTSRQVAAIVKHQDRLLALMDTGDNSTLLMNQSILRYIERHRLDWSGQSDVQAVLALQQQLQQDPLPKIRNSIASIDRIVRIKPANTNQLRSTLDRLLSSQQSLQKELERAATLLESSLGADQIISLAMRIQQELTDLLDATRELNQQLLDDETNQANEALATVRNQQSSTNRNAERLARQLDNAQEAAFADESSGERFAQAVETLRKDRLLAVLMDAEKTLRLGQTGQTIPHQQEALQTVSKILRILNPGSETANDIDLSAVNLNQQINEVVEQLKDYKEQLDQAVASDQPIGDEERRELNERKDELQKQLADLKNAIEASQFSGINELVESASDAIAGSSSDVDPRLIAREANEIARAIDNLQRAALKIAQQSQEEASEGKDLSTILELLKQLQVAQSGILEWSEKTVEKAKPPESTEVDRFLDLQKTVRQAFQPVQDGLQTYPTASILTTSIARGLAESKSRLEKSTIDLESVSIQRRTVSDMNQLREALEIQLQSNRQADEVESEDSSEEQAGSAGISSLELTMLYVMQKGLQQETEQWQTDLRERGEENDRLSIVRKELAQRQVELADVLKRLLQKTEETIPDLPDF